MLVLQLEKIPEREISADGSEEEGEEENITDFHHLLLVKILRPDRFKAAMDNYVKKHVVGTSLQQVSSVLIMRFSLLL